MTDTVRSISVDGHEFELRVGDDLRPRAFVVSPTRKLSDPRFRRRMRNQLRDKGLTYDACWRNISIGNAEKVLFATFTISARLRGCQRERLLDIVEESLTNALTVNPFKVFAPVMAA